MADHRYQKLQDSGIFQKVLVERQTSNRSCKFPSPSQPLNLIAYDGVGCLYVWNSKEKLLHYVEIRHSENLETSSFDSDCLLCNSQYKTLKLDKDVDFEVRSIKFNRSGKALLLVGDGAVMAIDLVSHISSPQTGGKALPRQMCRTSMIGNEIFRSNNGRLLHILHVSWHSYSDTHVGILSSDGVFRLFNLVLEMAFLEQEYHLQPSCTANTSSSFSKPISFAFGGEHLWDRFTVFVLFTNGSIYALCPVVPFGSLYNSAGIKELARDAGIAASSAFGAVANAPLALSWLETVFPDNAVLNETSNIISVSRAHPHIPFEASLVLQGPLPTVWSGDLKPQAVNFDRQHANMILYNIVGKDSILAVSSGDGQVLFYALADEVQPMWNMSSTPHLVVDDDGRLLSMGMLVEMKTEEDALLQVESNAGECRDDKAELFWTGKSPPLLQLAVVDLALHQKELEAGAISVFADPFSSNRFLCYHAMGVDAILLRWLPFSDQGGSKSCLPPVVYPVLDTRQPNDALMLQPLLGATAMLDSFGKTWLIAVTSVGKSVIVKLSHQQTALLLPEDIEDVDEIKNPEVGILQVISAELLQGPKDIHILQSASSASLTVDTLEGRAFLHDQSKLLHEKYIEYAHRVDIELKLHKKRLEEMFQDIQDRLSQVQDNLRQAKKSSEIFDARIAHAFQRNKQMQERIKNCNALPGIRQKPLTVAEQEFGSYLDTLNYQDMEIMKSAVEVLKLRAERLVHRSETQKQKPIRRSSFNVPDSQMRSLKSSLNRLLDVVQEASKKIDILDETIQLKEALSDN